MKQNKPSFTAFLVLLSILTLHSDAKSRHLVNPRLAAWCAAAVTRVSREEAAFSLLAFLPNAVRRFLLGVLAPCMAQHYVARKRYIEQTVYSLIREKRVSQVVNIGAGFDGLLVQLKSDFPNVRCVEIDHPATQRVKIAVCENVVPDVHGRPGFIACDLSSTTFSRCMAGANGIVDRALPTVLIAEGVLMYLHEKQVKEMLEDIRKQFSSVPTYLIFGALHLRNRKKTMAARISDWILKDLHESYYWSMREDEFPTFLHAAGFVQQAHADPLQLAGVEPSEARAARIMQCINEHYHLAISR